MISFGVGELIAACLVMIVTVLAGGGNLGQPHLCHAVLSQRIFTAHRRLLPDLFWGAFVCGSYVSVVARAAFDDVLKDKVTAVIWQGVFARFIPNEMAQIAQVTRTLSVKKLEVPVKKLLLDDDDDDDADKVENRDTMANLDSFDFFIAYAHARANA